jgi:hypothetical protein
MKGAQKWLMEGVLRIDESVHRFPESLPSTADDVPRHWLLLHSHFNSLAIILE